jgi:hypothetical protein
VEVLDPEGGWYTVDPTPADGSDGPAGAGLFAKVGRFLGGIWNQVTGFNAKTRDAALAWLAALPGRLGRAANDNLTGAAGILALLLGWLFVRRRRPGPVAVRTYLGAVRRAGLAVRPGETPRELLARARVTALAPKRLERLKLATAMHEAARYGAADGG